MGQERNRYTKIMAAKKGLRKIRVTKASAASLRLSGFIPVLRLRNARVPRDKRVLAAIRHGENTWERLHAYFPEIFWSMLGSTLTDLQRTEKIHRDHWGTFRLGPA